MSTRNSGFSLVEIIVALAIFSVIAGAGLNGFVPIMGQNRQSSEIITANRLAEEGLEAARSIRNRDFTLFGNGGIKGVGISSNLWSFVGTSDVTDKFVRKVTLTKAQRDIDGNMVSSGGVTDPDTFLVNSQVTWNYSIGQTKNFSLDSVLTNWKMPVESIVSDGLFIYSDGSTKPPWRYFNSANDAFGKEKIKMPVVVGSPRNFIMKTSPISRQAMAGVTTSTGVLYVYCFDGDRWYQDWSVTVGGTATTRRFDIAYETTSGDAVVLYSRNVATTDELAFRKKAGGSACGVANWGAATNFNPARTTGIVQWVKLIADKRSGSNILATIWADANRDLSGAIWNGTTFANEPTTAMETSLEIVSTAQDVDDFDLIYESISGDLMVVWANSVGSNGTNGVRYRTCTGGTTTCTWSGILTPPTFRDDATNLDISASQTTDELVFASIGNAGSDLQIGYWDGSAWTNKANVDTAAGRPLAGTKLIATGWTTLGADTNYVVVYMDSTGTGISWYIGRSNGTPSAMTDFVTTPAIGNPKKWIEIHSNPVTPDRLMVIISDVNSDLFAKRAVMTGSSTYSWSNSDGGVALETTLSQATVKPFAFAYFQQ